MQNSYKHTLAKLIAHNELTHCEIIDFIGLVHKNELSDAQIAAERKLNQLIEMSHSF